MTTLLIAINAKYTHTNLAVRYLQNALAQSGIPAHFSEYTINQSAREILTDLVRQQPERLLFSCYIWNIAHVQTVATEYRLLFPHAQILLGGPEVSFDAEQLLAQMPWANAIVCGEGELLLPQVLHHAQVSGVYRANACVDLDALPFPYQDLSTLVNRVLYYESSRGCPYGCAYCLSSADTRVRWRSLPNVYADLQRFLDARVMKVKFVDRTFNLNAARDLAIWRYLIANDNGVTSFQMELGGDLTTPEQLALLKTARVGLFQFEIGVQSTSPETLRQVARATDMEKLKANVATVKQAKNIHQHLDLIAGLPSEGFDRFAQSYNEVFAMRPEQLQLGFLKLLRGSRLYGQREALGLLHSPHAPYEVLQTPALSFQQLSRLKVVEAMTEAYYNSGRFTNQLEYLLAFCQSPFDALLLLGEGFPQRKVTQYEYYDLLYAFALAQGCAPERMAWLMRLDLCLHERPHKLPRGCAPGAPPQERKARLPKEQGADCYFDLFPSEIVGVKGTATVVLAFDYAHRDPWGHAAVTVENA
ncbi:MAG: DUF4080 domain-containing protein [Clostridia bacterium]